MNPVFQNTLQEDDEDEEEEGLTWDQLEENAKREDKEKGDEDDSEDDRQRWKVKAGKGRPMDSRDSRGMPSKRPKVR